MQDQPEPVDDLQNPDETRPAKRVRLEAPLAITEDLKEEVMDESDWEEVYGGAKDGATVPGPNTVEPTAEDLVDAAPATLPTALPSVTTSATTEDQLVAPKKEAPQDSGEDQAHEAPAAHPSLEDHDMDLANAKEESTNQASLDPVEEPLDDEYEPQLVIDVAPANDKSTDDPEFMAAATAQKSNENSEWQFDSSSSSDSSDSDTSSSDSDDESDAGYELLDPTEAARILMSGEGDDGGETSKSKNVTEHQPRTANEVKEEVIPKPDIEIRPETKITLLGTVEQAVDSMALVKGATTGEYQVVEPGSALCNEKREVVGVIADLLGKVQEPLYSVAFTNSAELEEAGMKHGANVYYVDAHSTYVFTGPLKNMKYTDASNFHDEEAGEAEIEFSDDEAEAEYKRERKAARQNGRGTLSRTDFQNGVRGQRPSSRGHDHSRPPSRSYNHSDAPTQNYGGGMSYDDGAADDFYQPLKRPDNLAELMAGGGAPPIRNASGFVERGRGRGRGDRGRGDRGRGRGDRGRRGGLDHSRGGRGNRGNFNNHQQNDSSHRSNHRSSNQNFADRQNGYSGISQDHTASYASPAITYPAQGQTQQPAPQAYQFNGQTYQYGTMPQFPPPMAPAPQGGYYGQVPPQQAGAAQVPHTAYTDPAFLQRYVQPQQAQQQQAQQQQAQQQPAPQPQWNGHQNPQPPAPSVPQPPDFASILRRLA